MRNDLCQAILDCGSLDLNILDDVEYDFYDIVERLRMEDMPVTLASIVTEIFLQGISDINKALEEAIEETEIDLVNAKIDEDEVLMNELEDKLENLKELEPDRDIEWYFNYLDTSIYFTNNSEIYRDYLSEVVEEVETNMGFSING